MIGLFPNRILKGAALVLILGCDDGSGPPSPIDTTAHLVFRVQPSTTTYGQAFTPPVVVTINDANNRVLPVDTLVIVRLRDWPRASYGGTVSVRSIQGIATFDDLHIDGAGSGYTLSAQSDIAVDSAISDTFSVRFTPTITYNSNNIPPGVNVEVYGTTLDGSVKVNLTHDSAPEYAGRWSSDGARLLVGSYRTGDLDLYALDSNSLGLTNLTQHTGNDYNGTWFPNGQRIAFLSDRDGDGGQEIYVMNSDGSAQTRLTSDSAAIRGPIISPDGTQILYSSWRRNTYNVYVMGADGSNRITLAADTTPSLAFAWSPRGDQIAFGAGHHLILARPDGSSRVEIVGDTVLDSTQAFAAGAVFSPDGGRLAFNWYPGRNPGVVQTPPYVLTLDVSNIDGSGLQPLGQGYGGVTEWSPDGTWLLTSYGLEGVYSIGLVRPDGRDGYFLAEGYGARFRP
jgi:Tol biopolymer transport system component